MFIGIGLRLTSGVASFNPISLFATGSQGFWLEPSDLTTMFTDRAGTTPVTTPGQTVGLRLDKSKGLVLGSELVTNGDFSGGSTGWTTQAGWSISGGAANATTVVAANVSQLGILTVGKYYKISFTISNFTAGFGAILVITPNFVNVLGNGTYTVQGFANSTAFQVYAGPTSSFSVDNISVKELPGNHAVAPTDAARPTYGIEPWSGRRNLLTRTEEFGDAVWTKGGVTVSANTDVAPDGTTTADRLIEDTSTGEHRTFQNAIFTSGLTYTFSVYVKPLGRSLVQLTSSSAAIWTATFDVTAGSVTNTVSGTASISAAGNGWFRLAISATSILTASSNLQVRLVDTGINTVYTGNGTSGILIWGAQLELGSTATNYQRVGTAFNVTEAGVATVHYVQYDGTDDSFSTSSINFTATDKMSVFAGVRKLSDATTAIFAELSADTNTNNGTFFVAAPITNGGSSLAFASKGTVQISQSNTGYVAPISNVVTGQGNIGGPNVSLRVNGATVSSSTSSQGTGNFGNYPLFIGRRGNTSLPFNGRDYGIIIVGKAASATEISSTESYLAANTSGVTL
jgi:hypothetical protein